MVFYIGSQTLCTTSITNASAGTVTCNAADSGLAVGSYTVNFTFTSTNSFYSSVTGTTTLVITKAPLTVTPNNFSRQYGQPIPPSPEPSPARSTATSSTSPTRPLRPSSLPSALTPSPQSLTPVGSASLNNYTVTTTPVR